MTRIATIVAVLGVAVFLTATPLSAKVTDNSASFADPAGDVPAGAPDITGVTVSNDARGVITFVIHISGWPTIAPGRAVAIQFDSDDNLPSRDWMDHYVRIFQHKTLPEDEDFGIHYNGESAIGHPPKWMSYSWRDGVVTISVDGRLLTVTGEYFPEYSTHFPPSLSPPEKFRFRVLAQLAKVEEVGYPDTFYQLTTTTLDQTDIWSYEVEILRDLILKSFRVPKVVRAGKILTASMTAVRDDTGELATGKVACRAKIGKKSLRPWSPPLATGATRPSATCSWRIFKNAKGKTVKGEISLTVPEGPRGVTETKQFFVKVT